MTRPPSTTRFWPVMERAHGEAKKRIASANSSGVVTDCSGVPCAMKSKTSSGVAAEASVLRSRPGQHVDGDAARSQVGGEGAGEGEQGGLRGGVVVVRHDRVLEEVGADGDDAARTELVEARQRGLGDVEGALDGARELALETPVGDLVGLRAGVAVEGEVDERVGHDGGHGRAERLAGLCEQGVDLRAVTDVRLDGDRLPRVLLDERLRLLRRGEVVDHDLGALTQERLGDGLAEPAGSAGDQHDLLVDGCCGDGHAYAFLGEKAKVAPRGHSLRQH